MMREQIHYATGVRLEVVRPRALYTHTGVPPWQLAHVLDGPARRPPWDHTALIFRSSYFNVSLFLPVLQARLDTCAYPLQLRIVRGPADFVAYRELRRYRA